MRHRIAAGIVTCAVLAIPAAATARSVSDARPDGRGAELPEDASRRGRGWRHRQQGPRARHPRPPPFRDRERGQGDAAGELPAQGRAPGSRPEQIRARAAEPHDQGLVELSGGLGVLPHGRRAAPAARTARRHGPVLDLLLVDPCVLQRARPGEVLLAAREAHAAALPRLRDKAASLDRPETELGHSERRPAARLLGVLQGRLARHQPRPARAPGVVRPLPRDGASHSPC